MKKFLLDSKMFEFEKHCRECQKNNLPFISGKINPASNNYVVKLDLITCDYNLSDEIQKEIEYVFIEETKFLKKNNLENVFKGFNIDKELSWYDGVIAQRLDCFCETLFDLSTKSTKF